MALLLELFCSCFKWLIQIKHGILFLVKAAAALSELGCFYQCYPPPPSNRMAREDQGNFTPAVTMAQAQQPWESCPWSHTYINQAGLLLAMTFSLS